MSNDNNRMHLLLEASELLNKGITEKKLNQPLLKQGSTKQSEQGSRGRPKFRQGYTCVRVRFHRSTSIPHTWKTDVERNAENSVNVQVSWNATDNVSRKLSQRVSQFKKRKFRQDNDLEQTNSAPQKRAHINPSDSYIRGSLKNVNKILDLSKHKKIKMCNREFSREKQDLSLKCKTFVNLLGSTRLSYMIVQRSVYPQHQREKTFWSCLMFPWKEDTFECEINWADSMNVTVLMLACSQPDNVHMVYDLLSCGANPLSMDLLGQSPLHYAASRGALEVIKLLVLQAGVPAEIHGPGLTWTPMLSAVVNKRWDSVNLLSTLLRSPELK